MTASARAPSSARPASGGRSKWVLIALAGLTLLALVLRIIGVDQSLYGDEDFTYYIVVDADDLGQVWDDVYNTSITPPLHYVLAWLSLQFGGDPTELVRLPSLVFGTAVVPLGFLLGRRAGGDRAGLLAAAVIALSPFAIWYSDEARNYATMMFCVALSTFALLRALDDDGRRRWWVVYAVSACAALWCHYTAAFVLGAQAAWAAWVHREHLKPLAIATGAIALGYLPWLPGFLEQRRNNRGIDIIDSFAQLNFNRAIEGPVKTVVGLPEVALKSIPGALGLALLAVILILAAIAFVSRPLPALRPIAFLRSEAGLLLILALATPVGLLLYAATGTSLYLPRNLSASAPALAVLLAVGVSALAGALPRRAGMVGIAAFVAVLAAGTIASMDDEYRRPPYKEATHYVGHVAAAGDPIVEVPPPLARDKRLPQTTLDRYVEGDHPVYRGGKSDGPAWRRLRAGGDVYEVIPNALTLSEIVEERLPPGQSLPPDLARKLDTFGGPDGRAVLRKETEFEGGFPISVLRYKGHADGRIVRRDGRELITWWGGRRIAVTPNAARGAVELITPAGKTLVVIGWALRRDRPELVDWILTFNQGRLIGISAPGGTARPELARAFGPSALLAGFQQGSPGAPPDRSDIRVFAVVGNRASELPLTAAAKRGLGE